MTETQSSQSAVERLTASLIPHRFVAAQLRRPSGRFGRWVMTRGLNHSNQDLIQSTLDALSLHTGDCFADIGFGGGRALELAASYMHGPLWGVDYSGDMVLAAMHRFAPLIRSGRLHLLCADVADLPLRDGLLSAICSTNTIYFWPDALAALASVRRVLCAGGRLALGFSGAEKMRSVERLTRHGFNVYEPEAVQALLQRAGFSKVRVSALDGAMTRGDFVCLANV